MMCVFINVLEAGERPLAGSSCLAHSSQKVCHMPICSLSNRSYHHLHDQHLQSLSLRIAKPMSLSSLSYLYGKYGVVERKPMHTLGHINNMFMILFLDLLLHLLGVQLLQAGCSQNLQLLVGLVKLQSDHSLACLVFASNFELLVTFVPRCGHSNRLHPINILMRILYIPYLLEQAEKSLNFSSALTLC